MTEIGMTLLTELRMLEYDFVRSDCDRQISNRRLADTLPVDPHFRPRGGIQIDDTLWQIERNTSHLPGRHLHDAARPISERLTDELQLVPSRTPS